MCLPGGNGWKGGSGGGRGRNPSDFGVVAAAGVEGEEPEARPVVIGRWGGGGDLEAGGGAPIAGDRPGLSLQGAMKSLVNVAKQNQLHLAEAVE